MEKIDAIFFIGPQGSGKGTQARTLSEKLGFFYWENGAILRQIAHEDSDLGRQAKDLHDRGVLFPDELIFIILKQRMSEIPKDNGVIFDGIPRRVGQAEFILKHLEDEGRKEIVSIFLDIPKEESLERLLKRAGIENRPDDTKEKIEFRLKQYYEDTVPMLDLMREKTKFISIDARPSIEEVTSAINQALGI